MAFPTPVVVISTVLATLVTLTLLKRIFFPLQPRIYRSPLTRVRARKVPSALENMRLEHNPDEFPGARDVDTPFGSIRVYEFGPVTGHKVLFIHGISTSCMALSRIAHTLTRHPTKPCRVMLFDLFGRGFSDAPAGNHDAGLYTTQILLALASSPLPWTGSCAMSIIGYSMGGALAVSFATTFPHMLKSLVLFAPAGLIREENFGMLSRLVFRSGLVPPLILKALTKQRLRQPIAGSVMRDKVERCMEAAGEATGTTTGIDASKAAARRLGHSAAGDDMSKRMAEGESVEGNARSQPAADTPLPSREDPLEHAVGKYIHWMLDHHPGFIPAFLGCVAAAPLTGQQEEWRKLGRLIRNEDYFPNGVVVILGKEDEIVHSKDYELDAKPLLLGGDSEMEGKGRILWKLVGGGHNFPMSHAKEALTVIYQAWGMRYVDDIVHGYEEA